MTETLMPAVAEIPTREQIIESEVKKLEALVPNFEELQKQCEEVDVQSIDDKEGYRNVCKLYQTLVKVRTGIEDKRKELNEFPILYKKSVDNKAKTLTDIFSPLEMKIRQKKEKYDAWVKEKERKEEEAKQAKKKERHQQLISAGMSLVANEYVWNSFDNAITTESFHQINLELLSDEDFALELERLSEVIFKDRLREADFKKKQEEERIRVENEKRELELERKKMQEEADKIRLEKEKLLNQILETRESFLFMAGLEKSQISDFYFYRGRSIVSKPQIVGCNAEEWTGILDNIKVRISEIDVEIENQKKEEQLKLEKEQQQKVEQEKRNALIGVRKQWLDNLGLTESNGVYSYEGNIVLSVSDIAGYDNEGWNQKVNSISETITDIKAAKEKELLKKQQEEEQERINGLSDKQAVAEYIKNLLSVNVPTMKSVKNAKKIESITDFLKAFKL